MDKRSMLNKDYYYAGYSYADYQLPMNQGRDPWTVSPGPNDPHRSIFFPRSAAGQAHKSINFVCPRFQFCAVRGPRYLVYTDRCHFPVHQNKLIGPLIPKLRSTRVILWSNTASTSSSLSRWFSRSRRFSRSTDFTNLWIRKCNRSHLKSRCKWRKGCNDCPMGWKLVQSLKKYGWFLVKIVLFWVKLTPDIGLNWG